MSSQSSFIGHSCKVEALEKELLYSLRLEVFVCYRGALKVGDAGCEFLLFDMLPISGLDASHLEKAETTSNTFSHLTFDKGTKHIYLKKDSLFNKWCRENWLSTY